MDMMLKSLTKKLPCKVGPWTLNQAKNSIKEKDLYKSLPEDVDFVESYVFN